MRTKKTNFLQIVILITAIIYLFAGISYFISPGFFANLLKVNVNEEWIKQVKFDEFLLLNLMIGRGLSILFTVTGLSLILPLYDPLRYRGLVYYMGALFPFAMAAYFIPNAISSRYFSLVIMGGVYLFIFIINMVALLLTKKDASRGIE